MREGSRVTFRLRKWDGEPHWTYAGTHLGRDEHGDWVGLPARTQFSRPGRSFRSPNDQVVLVPPPDAADRGWLAGFHAPGATTWPELAGGEVQVYVDVTSEPAWTEEADGFVLSAVDLDLDVVRGDNGVVIVDDEDEFEEHRVSLDYPDEVVTAARTSCRLVRAAVEAAAAPYDDTFRRWLAAVR